MFSKTLGHAVRGPQSLRTKCYSLGVRGFHATVPNFSSASSSGVIADPYVPRPESGGPSLLTPAGYRYRYARLKSGLKSTYAAAKMRQKFDDFEPTAIGNALCYDVAEKPERGD